MVRSLSFLQEVFRLARYSLVGGLALIAHATLAFSLILWTDTPATIAHLLGFILGFFIAAHGHHTYTFKESDSPSRSRRRFLIVCGAALLISELALIGLQSGLTMGPIVAQTGAIAVSCVVSYAGSRFWAFKPVNPDRLQTSPPGADLAA